jgi:hypothetical protein
MSGSCPEPTRKDLWFPIAFFFALLYQFILITKDSKVDDFIYKVIDFIIGGFVVDTF